MAWLERFGLADRAKSKLEDLSHGNQQRVQLATALVHDPELLVLDEPFSGLDPLGIATMSDVLRERAAAGVGVVFSSHQLDLVEEVCEDVVIISRGRVVAEGAIGELKARSGRRHLEVEVVGHRRRLARRSPGGHTVLEREGDRVKLLVDESVDLDALLAAARAAGEVRRFSFEPPRLSELFMEAVAAPQPRPRGSWHEPAAVRPADPPAPPRVRLVAAREIIERGRSRGYLLSLLFTVFLPGGGFVLPATVPAAGPRDPARAGRRRRRPALAPALEATAAPYEARLELSRLPDRAAPRPRSADEALDAALDVPADLSARAS